MKKETQSKSLLDRWKNKSKQSTHINLIEKAPEEALIPLSPGQKRLWFLQQLHPENAFYNYSETYTFNGALNIGHLEKSLRFVYRDHDILRTTYKIKNDTLVQEVDNTASLSISKHDLTHYEFQDASEASKSIMKNDATTYFSLTKGPLVRASIIKLSNTKHILQITLHHIVTDKWSMGIFREHLAGYYLDLQSNTEIKNRKTLLQYSDYCYWINKQDINKNDLEYWKQKLLHPNPSLSLPFDYERPLHPSFKGAASFTQEYNQSLSSQLLKLSKTCATTPYNLMLAVFYLFLHKCSGDTDILVGTPLTNRDQKNLESLIGFFNDTIVLRTHINSEMSLTNFVKHVTNNTLEAFSHKDVPFNTLVKAINTKRSLAVNPFFQVMFLYHSKPENPFFGKDLDLSHTWFDSEVSKFDLTIYIGEENGILSSTFEYSSDLFEEKTINRFQEYFKILLESIVANPFQKIADLKILTPSERDLFSQQNTLKERVFKDKGIHNIIEETVLKNPNKKAVSFKDECLSYHDLNSKANALAGHILMSGIVENAVIGLCCERSTDMIVGILGILKSGCSYLPLDPEYPNERIDFSLNDSKAKIIVTQSFLIDRFNNDNFTCISIDTIDENINSEIILPQLKETDLAYIIYTSGSTGKPKGVPISHKNIINSTMGRLDFYDSNPEVFMLMSSIAFDSSKAGIFWTLCTGGHLVITEKRIEQDIDKIGELINNCNITHTLMLPSLYNLILDFVIKDKLKSLNTVIVAGEACTVSLCEKHIKHFSKIGLYNEYGPTEASVWCIAHKIDSSDLNRKSIPIGKPVANAGVYILDKGMNISPTGVPGELFIGGQSISKGYINRDDLTKKVFIKNPFKANDILYKTGDLAKYTSDGKIIFLGRADQQVKIRGFRVELSEIENVIKQYDENITDVVVQAEEGFIDTDFNLDTITEEKLAELLTNVDDNEFNIILNSIKFLSTEEKGFLLNQI
ncbi:non-ribosomal peptide synthetase [Algibacter mikhailovii]|uniref:Amino acid adenylation domain-containing protein n=1 Tax=Algibacter mikhailovii TaxID=425498 RepID=A0A918V5S8_9FLAO|nr:amino acid adenylation domain-containing protein [Algibacter mikhailovii]GGZ71052.1 hypothetical protein GCM10007028_05320 [Algibacter mikhailovii]